MIARPCNTCGELVNPESRTFEGEPLSYSELTIYAIGFVIAYMMGKYVKRVVRGRNGT